MNLLTKIFYYYNFEIVFKRWPVMIGLKLDIHCIGEIFHSINCCSFSARSTRESYWSRSCLRSSFVRYLQ